MFQPFAEPLTLSNTAPPPPPSAANRKRKRQRQDSRATAGEWVQGLPNRHLVQPARILGLDPGRKALTAVVHSQQAADGLQAGRSCEHRYDSLSNQASMLLYWLPQQPKWLAVPSSCTTFVTGCSTQQPLRPTLETGSCAGAPSSSGSRHTLPSARKSVEAVKKLLWPMEMPSSAAAAAREIPAHLQCHCGGNLGTAVRCMTRMNSAQASFVVLARQPWIACLSLS